MHVTESTYGMALSNAWSDEERRLVSAEELFDPTTFRHLGTVGISAGRACLEVGAGAGSVARFLADKVGPTGSVLVTDVDTRLLHGLENLPNVEVRVHDICTDPLPEQFDIIHARLLLQHLPDRLAVLKKLVDALRPDGWMLIEDTDLSPGRHLPAARQFVVPKRLRSNYRRLMHAVDILSESTGQDPEFGRELPAHLVEAGLVDVDAEVSSRLITGGSSRSWFFTLSLHEGGAALVATGALAQRELDELIDAFETSTSGLVMNVPMVSAWGRRQA